jgi:hypothetical protein
MGRHCLSAVRYFPFWTRCEAQTARLAFFPGGRDHDGWTLCPVRDPHLQDERVDVRASSLFPGFENISLLRPCQSNEEASGPERRFVIG